LTDITAISEYWFFILLIFIKYFNYIFLFYINRDDGINQTFKTLIIDYVSDDLVRAIFSSYMVYTPATKDDRTALDILKLFLCRALGYHVRERLDRNFNHDETLNNIKNLDHITKELIVKSRLYTDIINSI